MDKVLYMQRLLSRCVECGDCQLWDGPTHPDGTPRIYPRVGSKSLRRLVWELREGAIPKGKIVVTSCDRPLCIEHLKLSTRAEVIEQTMARPDVAARKAAATRRARRARAPKMDMERARAVRASTKRQSEIAAEFGIAQSLVSRIINNISWREPVANPFMGLGAR